MSVRLSAAPAAVVAMRSAGARVPGLAAGPGVAGGPPGRRALDGRRQPGPGAHQRPRIAGGRRAGVRAAGAVRARPPRARARSGHQLVGQRRRDGVDVRAAARRQVPRRHAGRRRRGRVLVRAADRPRAPEPRGRLRLDARLPQHPAGAGRRAAARAVRDRPPVRAVPGQPGDGTGGDRLADGRAQVGARVRAPPRRVGSVPLRRMDSGRSHHAGEKPELLGSARAHQVPGVAGDARLEAAAAGAGVRRRRRDPAAGARRAAAGAPAPRLAARDGAGGAGVVHGDEHAAPAAQRSAHPPRDRPRDPDRGAGQAGLPGAGDPGDRPAAAQRLGRALGRRHVPVRSGAGAGAAWPRRGGRARPSRR